MHDHCHNHNCDCNDRNPLLEWYKSRRNLPLHKRNHPVKVVELRDAFNNLRYKIVMTSVDVSADPMFGKLYEVEVVNCFSAPDPLVVVHRPQDDELIRTYDEALEIF